MKSTVASTFRTISESNNLVCHPVITSIANNTMKMTSNLLKKGDLWGKYKRTNIDISSKLIVHTYIREYPNSANSLKKMTRIIKYKAAKYRQSLVPLVPSLKQP